jgi:hypothetical protein
MLPLCSAKPAPLKILNNANPTAALPFGNELYSRFIICFKLGRNQALARRDLECAAHSYFG